MEKNQSRKRSEELIFCQFQKNSAIIIPILDNLFMKLYLEKKVRKISVLSNDVIIIYIMKWFIIICSKWKLRFEMQMKIIWEKGIKLK